MSEHDLPARYTFRGPLGEGAMGSVLQVFDEKLRRTVALKVLKPSVHEDAEARFRQEAQVCAQLEHPAIVPTYDIGRTPKGRLYFTMKQVRGGTLQDAMVTMHREAGDTLRLGRGFRQVVDALRRTTEAVAFAHGRGVVHRDLKPTNIMLGSYGEVLVLDWGIARVLGSSLDDHSVRTDRSLDDANATMQGSISGTPAYMAPEQARGDLDQIGPATDIWALGVVLYIALSARQPFAGRGRARLVRVAFGAAPAELIAPWDIPETLAHLVGRCLRPDPNGRPRADEVSEQLASWLDGQDRRYRAKVHLQKAAELQDRLRTTRASASTWRTTAQAMLPPDPDSVDEERLWPSWDADAQAEDLLREARRLAEERVRHLRDALLHDPDLFEAHAALAETFRAQHEQAEREGRTHDAERLALDLRAHDRGDHEDYLAGKAWISLSTRPAAKVELHRLDQRHRRLKPILVGTLGTTPLERVEVTHGRWVLKLSPADGPAHTYPVCVARGEHWSPGQELSLPSRGDLGPDDVFVPAGWTLLGDDEEFSVPPQRAWVDSFVIRRFPYTWSELVRLMNALEASGQAARAAQLVPVRPDGFRTMALEGGTWTTVTDPEGWRPSPNHPLFFVTHLQATWVAALEADRTGQPWRLPTESEWEKAARGADGRTFPWGDHYHPSRAYLRHAWGDAMMEPPTIGARPADISVYGVQDLCGGYRDWTQSPDGAEVARGGSWNATPHFARAAYRWPVTAGHREGNVSFRLARTWP